MIEKIIELDQDDAKYQSMLDQPFFLGNQLPEKAASRAKDIMEFVDRVLD